MPKEPASKRLYVFFDGQSLFYAAKKAFGYPYPNFDPQSLAQVIAKNHSWKLEKIHFYTGLPDSNGSPFWHQFWTAKLAVMGTRGISTFTRPLRYRNQTVSLPNGTATTILVGQEKGIDVRIALDIVRFAREDKYDVGLIFSQDQDLSEAADEVRKISIKQNRWIKITRQVYDSCVDSTDYRPKLTDPDSKKTG